MKVRFGENRTGPTCLVTLLTDMRFSFMLWVMRVGMVNTVPVLLFIYKVPFDFVRMAEVEVCVLIGFERLDSSVLLY